MEKILNNIHVINMGEQPKPDYKETRKKWVLAGPNNSFYDEIIDLSQKSATNNAILQTKIGLTKGYQINFDGNVDEDMVMEDYDKIITDYEVFGAACVEVIENLSGGVYQMNHIPIQNMAYSKANEKNEISGMYYSRDWSNRKYTPIYIPFFDAKKKQSRSVLLIKKYWPGSPYQILPSYWAAQNWLKIDNHISTFHLTNLETGYNPGLLISLNNGIPDEKTQNEIVKKLDERFKGSNRAGRVVVLFNKAKDNEATIEQLESSSHHEMFITLNDMVLQNILSAHRISPSLAGIQTSGKLGGSSEYSNALKVFLNNVIVPNQKFIQENFNKILSKMNGKMEILNDDTLTYEFTENLIKEILTTNEMRSMMGYDNIEINKENE